MWKTKLQFLNFKASILNLWSNLLAVLWHFQHRLMLRSDKCLGRNVTLKNVTAELHYVTLWSVCVSVTWLMTCVLPKKQKKKLQSCPFHTNSNHIIFGCRLSHDATSSYITWRQHGRAGSQPRLSCATVFIRGVVIINNYTVCVKFHCTEIFLSSRGHEYFFCGPTCEARKPLMSLFTKHHLPQSLACPGGNLIGCRWCQWGWTQIAPALYQGLKTGVEWWQHDARAGFMMKTDQRGIIQSARICSLQGPRAPPATQGHQKLLSHGEINTLCHSAIHTEHNSSCYPGTYCFSSLIYEVG